MYTNFTTGDKTSFAEDSVSDSLLQEDAIPETILQDVDSAMQTGDSEVLGAEDNGGESMVVESKDGAAEAKSEPAAADKDKPAKVPKEQFPTEFFCKVCKAKCTGEVIYQQHLQGGRHRKNVANAKVGGPIIRNTKKKGKRVARLTPKLSAISEALLGLEYLIEHQKEDEAVEERYICELCEAKCDPRTVIFHMTGTKHRLAYLKKHHMDAIKDITNRREAEIKRSALSAKLAEIAKDVEQEHGRKQVQVKLELDPFYNPLHQKLEAQAQQKRQMRFEEGQIVKFARMGGGRGGPFGRGGRGAGQYGFGNRGGRGGSQRGGFRHGGDMPRSSLLGHAPPGLLGASPDMSFAPDRSGFRSGFESEFGGGRFRADRWSGGGAQGMAGGASGGYGDDYYQGDSFAPPSRSGSIQDKLFSEALGEAGSSGMGPRGFGQGRGYRHQENPYLYGGAESYEDFTSDDVRGRHPGDGGGEGRKDLGSLLKDLTQCLVHNEDDASMALQVSNALTQSLLSYRLRGVPSDLLNRTGQNTGGYGGDDMSRPPHM